MTLCDTAGRILGGLNWKDVTGSIVEKVKRIPMAAHSEKNNLDTIIVVVVGFLVVSVSVSTNDLDG
jgi:hypothetical protein